MNGAEACVGGVVRREVGLPITLAYQDLSGRSRYGDIGEGSAYIDGEAKFSNWVHVASHARTSSIGDKTDIQKVR